MRAHHGGAARQSDGRTGRIARAASGGETARSDGPSDRPSAWDPPVITTVASRGEGVGELVSALDRHHDYLVRSGALAERRRRRLLDRTREVLDRAARRWLWDETRADQLIGERLEELTEGRVSPYELAAELLDGLRQGTRS